MMQKVLLAFIAFLFIFANQVKAQTEETMEGVVSRIVKEDSVTTADGTFVNQTLQLEMYKGSLMGEILEVNYSPSLTPGAILYKVGDPLVVTRLRFGDEDTYYISDFVRRSELFTLFLLFAFLVIVIGGIRGAASLVGMGFSFLVIYAMILPMIISGKDAVGAAIAGSIVIIPVTFSLSHGLSKKTIIGVIGTAITLLIVGILSQIFVEATRLTGFSFEEAGILQSQLGEINMKGILLAGIIVATLGVLDDVTISQASIVAEIIRANPKLKPKKVFVSAMRVGRDHIASLVNTLVLVYAGASLPLMLLFVNSPRPFAEIINYEIVADEIVRTLVGSIGLVIAVPITTILAVYYMKR